MKKIAVICVLAILIVALLIFGTQIIQLIRRIGGGVQDEIVQQRHPLYYREYVMEAAERHDVDPALIFALILTESSFRYQIISPAGAQGLMQIMPGTFEDIARRQQVEHNPDDVFVPRVNIDFGTFYIRLLYNHFGDWNHAIIAYNAGRGNVGNWLQRPELLDENGRIIHDLIPFDETRNYITRVNNAWERYREILTEEVENRD